MIDHHTRLPPGVPIDDGERNSETRPQNRPRAVRRENMRTVQKTLLLAVVLSLFGAVTASSVAEAGQQQRHLTMDVSTKVVGEPSPGTVVVVECTPSDPVLPKSVRLGFDAQGRATVAAGDTQGWEIVPHAWTWFFSSSVFPAAQSTCTFTEIETGDATNVAWTCNDGKIGGTVIPCTGTPDGIPGPPSTFGFGPGPVTVLIDASDAPELNSEGVDVVFTNTYTAQPVNTTPNFTG